MDNLSSPANEDSESSNRTVIDDELSKHIHWAPASIFIAVFLAFIIVLIIAGNLVVCRLVWVCRRMRIPSFYFVVSMSCSDLLMGVVVIPISLGYHINFQTTGRWMFGHFFCNLWLFLNFVLCSASIYNLCVVSGDRYLAVTSPLTYISRMTDHRIKQIIGISWFCALVFAGFVIYGANASRDNTDNCSVWGLRYEFSVVVLVAGYILPVSFLVFVNGKVFFIARSHMNRIHAQEPVSLAPVSVYPEQGTKTKSSHGPTRSRIVREIRIFKTFFIVTCAFLLCWTPFVVILLLDSILNVPTLIRHSSIVLLYCNSALNPFIYGFFNAEFRNVLSESLGCK